jgi:hypothetical protein
MYLRRIKELFKKAVSLETDFNVFDEIFHGLAKASIESENFHSFYESFLTITQYYQHSQAGRGSMAIKLLQELGNSEKMEFEFVLRKLPRFLGVEESLPDTPETKQRFDIINKIDDNLVLCELKMKVYSGCSAGRIELMEKFHKFVRLLLESEKFREVLKKGGIKNVYLVGGVLFNVEGNPATVENDKEFGICYNGLIKAREEIANTLKQAGIPFKITENMHAERAFSMEFSLEELKFFLIAVYGNEVAKSLFVGKAKHNIDYFKQPLEGMLFDDLWLGQIVAISERAILEQMFKTYKERINYLLAIVGDDEILRMIKELPAIISEEDLQLAVSEIYEKLKANHPHLLAVKPIPAVSMLATAQEDYDVKHYLGDIIQFLSCGELLQQIKGEIA